MQRKRNEMRLNAHLTIALITLAAPLAAQPAPVPVMPASPLAPSPSANAATRAAIARIEAANPLVNAVIAVDPTAPQQAAQLDAAPPAPRGPLWGQPLLVKDNTEVAGPLPTTAGSVLLLGNVTNRDAPIIARLRRAGMVPTLANGPISARRTASPAGAASAARPGTRMRSTATRAAARPDRARRSRRG